MVMEQTMNLLKGLKILSDTDLDDFQVERSWSPLLVLIPVFFLVRKLLITAGHTVARILRVAKCKQDKFAESFSFFAIYSTYVVINTTILILDGSFMNRAAIWENIFDVDLFVASEERFRVVELFQISFYLVCLFHMFFSDRRHHKDFPVMLIHHCVTIALIFISYPCPFYHRVAITIMLVHDISDVFLEGSKLLNYAFGDRVAQYTFLIFAAVFPISRLLLYPWMCVVNFIVFAPGVSKAHLGHPALSDGADSTHLRKSAIALLTTLQSLHIYWFALIVKMLLGKLRGHGLEDIRSPGDFKRKKVKV